MSIPTLRDWSSSSPLSAAHLQEVVTALRQLDASGITEQTGTWNLREVFPAIIVNAGPDGEPDPTDASYWIKKCYVGGSGDPEDAPTWNADLSDNDPESGSTAPTILRAWNYPELYLGTHTLETDGSRQEWVFAWFDHGNPTIKRYLFYDASGKSSPDVIATVNDDPSAGDESGIYKDAVRDTGETTGMPTDGMTVPTVSDTVIANLAEYKLNNKTGADFAHSHWIEPGRTVFGVENGSMVVGGDTRPIVVASLPNPYAWFEVYLVKDGYYGDPGSVSWTYTVKDLNGKVLGTHVPAPLYDDPSSIPKWWQSFPSYNGAFHGAAFYDENGNLQLAATDSLPVGDLFEVTLTGGAGSNATTPYDTATFTYTCEDNNGNVLTTGTGAQTPAWGRPQGVLRGRANNGLGYFTIGGVFVLVTTDEALAQVPGALFQVNLTTDGGTNGDGVSATDATYTYTVKTLGGTTLATAATPACGRPRGLLVSAAVTGQGYYDDVGNFVFARADEFMQIFACATDGG